MQLVLFLKCLKKYISDPATNLQDIDNNQWTPLIWAVVQGHVNIVKLILETTNETKKLHKLKKVQLSTS